jgi:hypothetical protein
MKKHYENILQKNEYNTNILQKPLSQPQKQYIQEDPKHHIKRPLLHITKKK